jgi:diaminohydroxyphosphoribosylaminopyrimidine deaminase / 5-amino-6-(5-phosphoribosylamino)uracil reductase
VRLGDAELMDLALGEAAAADYATSPNPMVGAVVAHDGEVVSVGRHERAGEPHAEVNALRAAAGRAERADLFVTLEPCTVHGRTAPCVDAVIAARPRRVVIAMLDPNPAVAGRGAAALEAAGIVVTVGLGGDAAERLNRFYLTHMRTGRPFVTAKFAASLDGRIATRTGDSRWITSEASRTLAHRLRERHDAVLVGVGTVLADDPALTVRVNGAVRQPRRVVVDSELRTPPSARLFASPGGPIIIATTDAATATPRMELERAGAEVLVMPAHNGHVDLGELLSTLGARQVISVLAEGGANVLGSLRDARLIDSVVAFLAPRLIGGADATAAIGGLGAASLADTLDLTDVEVERLGGDVIVTGYSVR